MARFAALLLPGLAFLLLGAHFFRAGLLPLAAGSVALVGLLLVRAPWAAHVVQAALVLGSLEWLRATWTFAAARAALDQPYGRLVAILGTVAALTALSAWLVRNHPLRQHFRLD